MVRSRIISDNFMVFTEEERDRINRLVRSRVSTRKIGRSKSEKILKVIREIGKITISKRKDVVVITDLLSARAVKEGMLKGVRGVLKTTGTTVVPRVIGEVAIVMFVLGMLENTNTSTKETILKVESRKPVFGFRKFKVSLLV